MGIVILDADLGGNSGANTVTWPSGFAAISGITDVTIGPSANSTKLTAAYKVATGSEPSTYTVTSSSGSGSDYISAAMPRVMLGVAPRRLLLRRRQPTFMASYRPITLAITSRTGAAGDDTFCWWGPINSNANGAKARFTAASGYANGLATFGGVAFSPLIGRCDLGPLGEAQRGASRPPSPPAAHRGANMRGTR